MSRTPTNTKKKPFSLVRLLFRALPLGRKPNRNRKARGRKPRRGGFPVAVAAPQPAQPREDARELSVVELLRPDESLRRSIEGFLLDQRSPHTRRAYGKDLKRFMKFLVTRPGDSTKAIDRGAVIAYKESLLGEGLEHTTVDRHLATLRSFFGWLADEGRIGRNPAEGVRFLNPRRVSRTIGFTDDEVKRILAIPDLHARAGAQHYAILMVLFHCGLRRSEVCSLRTSNLSVERGQAILRLTGKGNAERIVVLVPAALHAVEHYLKIARRDLARDEYLFQPFRNNRTGLATKPLDPSMIFHVVTRYAKRAGIANRVSPHSCRATAISNARDHDVPDRAIQEFAGWSSPDMITRYDKRKSAIEKSAAHAIEYGAADRARISPARFLAPLVVALSLFCAPARADLISKIGLMAGMDFGLGNWGRGTLAARNMADFSLYGMLGMHFGPFFPGFVAESRTEVQVGSATGPTDASNISGETLLFGLGCAFTYHHWFVLGAFQFLGAEDPYANGTTALGDASIGSGSVAFGSPLAFRAEAGYEVLNNLHAYVALEHYAFSNESTTSAGVATTTALTAGYASHWAASLGLAVVY